MVIAPQVRNIAIRFEQEFVMSAKSVTHLHHNLVCQIRDAPAS